MSDVNFLSGMASNLPTQENRQDGTFYLVGDEKKIIINDITLEDNTSLKNECKSYSDQLFGTIAWGGGEILYSSSTANFGTVTLSKNASAYTCMELYCMTDDGHVLYTKLYNPNGRIVNVVGGLVGQSNYFIKCKAYIINGTTISTANIAAVGGGTVNMAGLWGTHDPTTWTRGDNYIGIYQVVGYR